MTGIDPLAGRLWAQDQRDMGQMVNHSVVLGEVVQVRDVGGNVTINLSRPAYRMKTFPAARSWPGPEQARAHPSRLLMARYEVVPFVGRAGLLQELADWLSDPSVLVSVRLVHGSGGQGKTRLANQLAREHASAERAWQVWQAQQPLPSATSPFRLRLLTTVAGVLVLVDYADQWAFRDLQALLSDLHTMAMQLPAALPVRVLLLARSTGGWWQGLHHWLDAELDVPAEDIPLLPLGGEVDRLELFNSARDRFSALLSVADCQSIGPPDGLDDQRFDQVLTVQMAALAAVDARQHDQDAPTDPQRISAYLLKRERAHWQQWHGRSEDRLSTPPEVMARVAWVATLAGPLRYADASAVLERTGIAVLPENVSRILADHQRNYPSMDAAAVLEPLYPDRLGEDFVALFTPGNPTFSTDNSAVDAWSETALLPLVAATGGQQDPPPWTRSVLTVLIDAAHRWPHVTTNQLAPLLTAHPDLMLHAGRSALIRLADLPHIDVEVLKAVEAKLPSERHFDLDPGLAALSSRLLPHRMEGAAEPAHKAAVLLEHAFRLGNAGQYQAALEVSQQAVDLCGDLVRVDRDAHLPFLVGSLNNHAVRLAEVGRRTDALLISGQAVELLREVAQPTQDTHLSLLALALTNHANRLADIGQRADAIEISTEALQVARHLVSRNRDSHRPDLARALSNHASRLADIGRRAEAVEFSDEALCLYQEMADDNRDAHLPDLALALANHAVRLQKVGLRDEAIDVSERAVDLRRELAEANRDAHLRALAGSLSNHATTLADVGRLEKAVFASAEAVQLYREMASVDFEAHAPELAASLGTYAARLARIGKPSEAVPISEETLRLYRELTESYRDAFLPRLATSLNNHALRLMEVGRPAEAVEPSEEALRLRRELTTLHRDAHLSDLADSLANHAALLRTLGSVAGAMKASAEALRARRELVKVIRDAYLPDLAKSLHGHAVLRGQVGRWGEALVLNDEAIRIRRKLADRNPDAHMPELLESLHQRTFVLAEIGKWAESVDLSGQVLLRHRELVKHNRNVHLPGLAIALIRNATLLVNNGRAGDAVTSATEGVQLHRELLQLDRDAHLLGFAHALTVHGQTLSCARRHEEAVIPLVEALDLRQCLPAHAHGLLRSVVAFLSAAHRARTQAVDHAFEVLTGRTFTSWISQDIEPSHEVLRGGDPSSAPASPERVK
ncbi:tetratricopeptide repeat protein [Nonomuraea sp. NN258]|uniref:tetratricopeptide repeat protein n=1 Tax=Nonomuraea antri TaxID=2730852 RepID=UPI0015694DB1|nr:tetratricopeptide repeat protein [Nonomuraea antri]NRQ33936.1 tetratricopeptide repeat protein [Nonomuraea antri]